VTDVAGTVGAVFFTGITDTICHHLHIHVSSATAVVVVWFNFIYLSIYYYYYYSCSLHYNHHPKCGWALHCSFFRTADI